jgi:tripartite-type tricarboxylate transporter receptor subunit TctC
MLQAIRKRMSAGGILVFLAALALSCAPALAQADYPSRQIKVVVPFLAGGAVDVVTRVVFNKLAERWGQTVVIENRAGAGGNIGGEVVAKAEPDGYTLLATPPSVLAINQYLYDKMPFDPREAFAPVSLIGLLPNVLVVGPSVAAPTLQQWLVDARQSPDRFAYGSQGVGTTGHLTGAMLNDAAGLALRHIPYRGFPPALTDMIRGQVDMMFIDTGNALPRVGKDGLRALGVTAERRLAALPDVPTFSESGLANVISITWFAVVAPIKTPADIRHKLSAGLAQAMSIPDVKSSLDKLGVEMAGSTPEQLEAWIEGERVRWSEVVRRARIKVEPQ